MPEYDRAVAHSRVLRASPQYCFETVVDLDLFQLWAFRVLIGARGLPIRLADALSRRGDQGRVSSPPTFRLRKTALRMWARKLEAPK